MMVKVGQGDARYMHELAAYNKLGLDIIHKILEVSMEHEMTFLPCITQPYLFFSDLGVFTESKKLLIHNSLIQ